MRYVISDIHGEYALFMRLMDKIKFSGSDTLYVCGDLIDKGGESVRLLKAVKSLPNARCILGNHDYALLRYYWSLMKDSPEDFSAVLKKLEDFISPRDREPLGWDEMDWLESLPFFIEEDEFICVHAGLPLDGDCRIVPLQSVKPMFLLEDRTFMRPDVIPKDSKCVFFGHTPTRYVRNCDEIIAYGRSNECRSISDYIKVHLDTGVYLGSVLGCFCVDTCRAHYVKKKMW